MKKYSALLAAAALLVSTGIASAQSRNYDSSGAPKSSGSSQRSGGGMATGNMTGASGNTGVTGAPSSTNPQAGGGATASVCTSAAFPVALTAVDSATGVPIKGLSLSATKQADGTTTVSLLSDRTQPRQGTLRTRVFDLDGRLLR